MRVLTETKILAHPCDDVPTKRMPPTLPLLHLCLTLRDPVGNHKPSEKACSDNPRAKGQVSFPVGNHKPPEKACSDNPRAKGQVSFPHVQGFVTGKEREPTRATWHGSKQWYRDKGLLAHQVQYT